jgi:hypothetical protein
MATVEIQFREKVFFDIIAAQVLRTDVPAVLLAKLPQGKLVERIEAGAIGWASGGEVPFGDGELAVKVPITIHVTDLAAAKLAGTLQAPATFPVPAQVWLRLQGAPPSELRWFIQRVEVAGDFVPLLAPPRTIRLGDLGIPITDIVLAAGDGVVAVRCVTPGGGGGLAAVSSRLGGQASWGEFIEGRVFADTLAEELNGAADGAVAGSSDPEIVVSSRASGHWDPAARAAHASVGLVAVDALPADIDVPVAVYATTTIALDEVLDRLVLTTRVSWAAHDFITVGSGGLITAVEDKVSDAILDKLKPPHGQEEVERGDRYVVYRSARPLTEPVTNLFRASIDALVLMSDFAGGTGPVTVYPPPVAFFTLEDQHWESHVDCTARQWKTQFHPPVVHILGPDRFYSLQFRGDPMVDPPDAWTPRVSWSGLLAAGNQVAHVTFDIPPGGVKPVGSRSSGFIVTNLGVRWVDLGSVPARPAAPADPVGIQAYVISTCMAISDRWGMGVLNLEWLVDPPDLDLGMPALREWTIAALDVEGAERLELVARGSMGERSLAVVPVARGSVVAQVVTDATETLQVRGGRVGSPAPQVMQRWIVPWASVAVDEDARSLELRGDELFALGERGASGVEIPASAGAGAAASPRLEPHAVDPGAATPLAERRREGLVPRTAGRGRAVAVLHRGAVVFGFAGPLVGASEGVLGRPARHS